MSRVSPGSVTRPVHGGTHPVHALYNFNFNDVISDTEPAEDPVMPPELASFIADTLNRIYQEDPDPDIRDQGWVQFSDDFRRGAGA